MILTDHVIYQTTTQTLGLTFGYFSHVATKGERFFKHNSCYMISFLKEFSVPLSKWFSYCILLMEAILFPDFIFIIF